MSCIDTAEAYVIYVDGMGNSENMKYNITRVKNHSVYSFVG